MRNILIIFLISSALSEAWAQNVEAIQDSTALRMLPVDSSALKILKATKVIRGNVDSMKLAIDSLFQSPSSYADSIGVEVNRLSSEPRQRLMSINDSTNSVISGLSTRISSGNLRTRLDSLTTSAIPGQAVRSQLDSLSRVDPMQPIQRHIGEKQSMLQEHSDGISTGINEKVNLLSTESGGKGNLPQTIRSADISLPIETLETPNIALPDVHRDVSLPDIPRIDAPAEFLPGTDHPGRQLPEINVPGLGEINTTAVSEEMSHVGDKAMKYSKDIKAVKAGDFDQVQSIEQEIVSSLPIEAEIAAIQDQQILLDEKQAEIQKLQNREEYKKQTLQRARKVVAQHLTIYSNRLKESMGQVSAYQNKVGTILKKRGDLPKRRDPLKKLKAFERFVPGLTFHLQNPDAWLVDFNPSVRYRLTSYWSIGVGWNERIQFGKRSSSDESRVFGIRSFTEVILFKGISARLEAEDMNTFVYVDKLLQDAGKRVWIWSYMAGIKKEFTFLPKVTGNVQFMYNVFCSNKPDPYPTKLNVRFGFEYSLKSRAKN